MGLGGGTCTQFPNHWLFIFNLDLQAHRFNIPVPQIDTALFRGSWAELNLTLHVSSYLFYLRPSTCFLGFDNLKSSNLSLKNETMLSQATSLDSKSTKETIGNLIKQTKYKSELFLKKVDKMMDICNLQEIEKWLK